MNNKIYMNYDETKKMLNTLRNYQKKAPKKINESDESNVNKQEVYTDYENYDTDNNESEVMVVNDVEVNILSSDKMDLKLKDEQKNSISQIIDNFKQQVSQIVEFDPGFTIKDGQIRLDGFLTDEDIDFVYIAGEDKGLYINADMLKLNDEVSQSIDKLIKFEETFKTSMEPLIYYRRNN